jgi:aminopeptidase N
VFGGGRCSILIRTLSVYLGLMKKFFVLVLACVALSCPAQTPQRNYLDDPALSPHAHSLAFTHLRLELWPDPKAGSVKGKVTETFHPLRPQVDSFFLDGILMTVRSVMVNGVAAAFRVDSAGITVIPSKVLLWNTEDSVTIEYSATPRKGLYFIGWNDPNGLSRKQIWSQGEAVDNRYWIPLYDEPNNKLTTEMIVHFDKDYEVLSNGRLVEKKSEAGGMTTWHYAMSHPMADYLIMLGVGKYAIKETRSASGVPMHLYYYPEWKERVEPTYQYAEAMVDFYEKEIGLPYPWESYSQIPVQDYMYGAMENTTATVYGDFYCLDHRGVLDRTYIGVDAHELAHQWFGDYVTARSDAHGWLQESFATYYQQLFDRATFGEDRFEWERRGAGLAALEDSKHNLFGVANSEGGGNRIYGKGAFVLDMLKYVVGGREAYNKAILYYLQKHPYVNVDTHDLLVAFEESTGMDLQWFWDEWLYRGGEPEFHVDLSDGAEQTELVITQKVIPGSITGFKDGVFKMPVVVEFHYADGSVVRQTIEIEHQTEIVKVASKKLAFVLFDPGSRILKTVGFVRPAAMLKAQALGADKMLDRYDALVAMKGLPMTQKYEVLERVFRQEKFFAPRVEALNQLAADSCAVCSATVKAALTDTDVAVRKAALAGIDAHSARALTLLPLLEALLKDSSYDIVDVALQKLADVNAAKLQDYLAVTKGIEGNIGRNVRVRWLELAWLSGGKREYADELVQMASASYEFRTRVNAMAALKRMDYFSEPLTGFLVEAILNPNTRLAGPAGDLLSYFYNQDRYRPVIGAFVRAGKWVPWQQGLLHLYGM